MRARAAGVTRQLASIAQSLALRRTTRAFGLVGTPTGRAEEPAMHRRPFLVGAAGLAASGLMGMNAHFPQDDAALARLRRGDIGDTPFSRAPNDVDAGLGVRWTSSAVRLLQAGGASAKRVGRMHGTQGRCADLYAVDVIRQPLCLLIARQGYGFTDIAAGRSVQSLPLTLPRGSPNQFGDRTYTRLIGPTIPLS